MYDESTYWGISDEDDFLKTLEAFFRMICCMELVFTINYNLANKLCRSSNTTKPLAGDFVDVRNYARRLSFQPFREWDKAQETIFCIQY